MWKVGDRVFGKRSDDSCWYPGTVKHVDGERCYIIFDDGEDALANTEQLRPLHLQNGDDISVRYGEGSTYVPGSIIAAKGNRVRVRLEAGREDWIALARIRVPPETRRPGPTRSVRHEVGDPVLACWLDLFWYPGVILANRGDQYHVVFDNGTQELVSADKLRPVAVEVGDAIECRWQGGPAYYPGVVTSRNGEVIHVHYDDGDEETTLLRLARLERDEWLPAAELTEFGEGDRVLACWYDLNWYPGVIVSVTGKRIHMLFDDGDQAVVTPDKIKALTFAVGDRLTCRRGGGPIYYPGEITQINGEVIHINYDDGEEETTTLRLIRVEREGLRDQLGDGFV